MTKYKYKSRDNTMFWKTVAAASIVIGTVAGCAMFIDKMNAQHMNSLVRGIQVAMILSAVALAVSIGVGIWVWATGWKPKPRQEKTERRAGGTVWYRSEPRGGDEVGPAQITMRPRQLPGGHTVYEDPHEQEFKISETEDFYG